MKRIFKYVILSLLLSTSIISTELIAQDFTPIKYVAPFIGTANHGNADPGARAPWGNVSMTPLNVDYKGSDYSKSVYSFGWRKFYGISHVNFVGKGCQDKSSIILLPFYGKTDYKQLKSGTYYKNEDAAPGYYKVEIGPSNRLVPSEFTATKNTGMGRFIFPKDSVGKMFLNLGLISSVVKEGELQIIDDNTIGGVKINNDANIYFTMKFNKKIKASSKFEDSMALYLEFAPSDTPLLVKTGISYTSIDDASIKLNSENPLWDFDAIKDSASEKWNKELSKIKIDEKDINQRKIFYTALYHSIIYPNDHKELNKIYPEIKSMNILGGLPTYKNSTHVNKSDFTITPGGLPKNSNCSDISTWLVFDMKNNTAKSKVIAWDDTSRGKWAAHFELVEIESSLGASSQPAFFYKSTSETPQPLIISLHTWSGDFTQSDPLSNQIVEKNYNYLHPNFRGPNNTPDACGSELVISDLEDAISYAIEHGNVDPDQIHIVGVSGGGYATLLAYMNIKYPVNSFSAWVPISDIESWYWESIGMKRHYAGHIMSATNSKDELDANEARRRSPYYQEYPKELRKDAKLYIYTGVHDGFKGSVPITQSIKMYNKLVKEAYPKRVRNLVPDIDIIELISKQGFPANKNDGKMLSDRKIHYFIKTNNISLTIFEGGHEQLKSVALELIPINK